jgi:IS30 family transposase
MSHYHHLSIEEREKIHECRIRKKSISETARLLGRSKATVSRELKRNGYKVLETAYSPSKAMCNYHRRRRKSRRCRILGDCEKKAIILELFVQRKWSPEQIANRLQYEKVFQISYPTIYRALHTGILEPERTYRNNGNSYPLERKLRHKNHKRRPEKKKDVLKIEHRIEQRPLSATNRSRFGHFEVDTLLGKRSSDYLVVLVDRKGRYLLMKKCGKFSRDTVTQAVIELLQSYRKRLHSLTPDRGIEFSGHKTISAALDGVNIYFTNPASPWEKPSVENTNGLLREYFPKGTSLSEFSDEDILQIQTQLNLRPRKCLGWKSPFEVFHKKSLRLI